MISCPKKIIFHIMNDYITSEISIATLNNRTRLGTNGFDNKLTSRANKRLSEKKIIPSEYLTNFELIQLCFSFSEQGYRIEDILFSLALNLTKQVKNSFLKQELASRNITVNGIIPELVNYQISSDDDLLGGVYQSLITEGEKNKKGSYYTPKEIVQLQIKDYYKQGWVFLDPCCGTGQYLLQVNTEDPELLRGCDIDEIAVKIARINLMCKFSNMHFRPNIFVCDSLEKNGGLLKDKFDMIATNPPWGAKLSKDYKGYSIKSGESFSYFLERSLELLKNGGIISYILPESILNVQVHKDIRKLLLNYNILKISELGRVFNGVFSPVIRLDIKKEKGCIDQSIFLKNQSYEFSIHVSNDDVNLFENLYKKPHIFLDDKNTDWALGIVTGNNKEFVSDTLKKGYIPVYTGKEVDFFQLKPVKKYLLFEPERFQQMANIEKFQTKQKLIYKFISNKLVFSLDTTGVYTLNSANIVIPKVNYPIKAILALFNCDLYQIFFQKKFNSIKVLKHHIQQLPLPLWDNDTFGEIEKMVDRVMKGKIEKEQLDNYIFNLFTK
ncbi:N-6 DNA methylase [candidate division SR1 bacterium]|nr:N-6 DNA methylase [candidate division SR1 bacterium]